MENVCRQSAHRGVAANEDVCQYCHVTLLDGAPDRLRPAGSYVSPLVDAYSERGRRREECIQRTPDTCIRFGVGYRAKPREMSGAAARTAKVLGYPMVLATLE